jgi:hypothetical protein
VAIGITLDALLVAERFAERLAERDARILSRVMLIDMQVAVTLTVRSKSAWRAKSSIIWSRKPIPVEMSAVPVPSREMETATSVSAVRRLMLAARIFRGPSREGNAFYQPKRRNATRVGFSCADD